MPVAFAFKVLDGLVAAIPNNRSKYLPDINQKDIDNLGKNEEENNKK